MVRSLRADEIDLRIGSVFSSGVTFLLYKNARVDMTILDETFGPMGWQRDHKEIKGNLYCGIGIWDENKKEWVWKWDCGTESFSEAEKGEASDSFKRAGFCIGIGRELYTAPLIFFKTGTQKKSSGKGYELANPNEFRGIYVKEFETTELDSKRIITKLVINQKAQGKDWEIYRWTYGR